MTRAPRRDRQTRKEEDSDWRSPEPTKKLKSRVCREARQEGEETTVQRDAEGQDEAGDTKNGDGARSNLRERRQKEVEVAATGETSAQHSDESIVTLVYSI